MRKLVGSFRTTLLVAATGAAYLNMVPSAIAQPGDAGREPSQTDIDLRRRMEPLVPSIKAALEGDNKDAQRASLAIAADFPTGLAKAANLPAAIAGFLLRDKRDPELIALGVRALGRMQPAGADLAKVIGPFAKSESVVVRRAAAESLATAIQNSPPAQKAVPYAKYFIDIAGQALPLLNDFLSDSDGETQRFALAGIQNATHTITELFTYDPGPTADEPKIDVAGGRFAPLGPVLRAVGAAVPKLEAPLDAKEQDTRLSAARTLEAIAITRRTILNARPVGEPAPNDPFPGVWASMKPILAKRLRDDSPHVRLAIVESLESLGDALEARELMRQAATDQVVFVRWTAARALGRSAPAKPVAAAVADDVNTLAVLAADNDLDVRSAAVAALGKYGAAAKSASSVLLAAATRGDVEPRVVAIKALGAVETDAERTVPVLIESLKDSDLRVSRVAATGLVRFGPAAKAALPELRKAIQSTDPELRLAAAEAILAIEGRRPLKEL
ncbi:MAG TPA: HEAT repeat domain-containing protein [Gemmataceae bacterium]|nr:HEAT repeat domain-containing protein [Gemmataceae bacterium]